MNSPSNNKAGFTLVELAIVIVVVGLIIGGVIKGQQMIAASKLNADINEVDGFKTAITNFEDKYGALPGDFSQAQDKIPGCADAPASCANGNGDGVLNAIMTTTVATSNEGRAAWQHLAYANMLTGVVPGSDAAGNDFGTEFPAAKTGGGFVLVNASIGGDTNKLSGLWLRLQHGSPSVTVSANPGDGELTPSDAAYIDRKMDDGNPLTGFVRAGGNADTCTPASGAYDETSTSRDCTLYFYMQ